MTALAEARSTITTALAGLGIPVFDYPPQTVSPPAAILVPGSPYLDPGAAWGSIQVGMDVRIMVSASSGQAAMERLDALVDAAVVALLAVQVSVGAVSAPSVDPDSAAIVVDIPTTCVWKDGN